MRLLVTSAHPTLQRYPQEHLGRLIQPRHYSSIEETAASGMPWAADNDAFNGGFDELAFCRMLDRIRGLPGCLFIVAPDVVSDAAATLDLYGEWRLPIKYRELPIALAAQDGLENERVPWGDFAALFIGGTTEWKMSPAALELVQEAQRRGKHVHFGRVNGFRRLVYANSIGCDTVDGSSWARWRDTWLPLALAHLASGQQLPLEDTCVPPS